MAPLSRSQERSWQREVVPRSSREREVARAAAEKDFVVCLKCRCRWENMRGAYYNCKIRSRIKDGKLLLLTTRTVTRIQASSGSISTRILFFQLKTATHTRTYSDEYILHTHTHGYTHTVQSLQANLILHNKNERIVHVYVCTHT